MCHGTTSINNYCLYSTPYAHETTANYTGANGTIQVNHDSLSQYMTRHRRSLHSSDVGDGIIDNTPPLNYYEKDGIDTEATPYEVPIVTINHVCSINFVLHISYNYNNSYCCDPISLNSLKPRQCLQYVLVHQP